MSNFDREDWLDFDIAVTPGEELQNWLAQFGLCAPVRCRSYINPEPEPGLWSALNLGAAVLAVTGIVGMGWLTIFYLIPMMETFTSGR